MISLPPHLNPRWALWLISRGEDPWEYTPPKGFSEPDLIEDGGYRLPRGVVFSGWIQSMWREWAATLGFTQFVGGSYPHERALMSGHTASEFDSWLHTKVSDGSTSERSENAGG